MEQEKFIANNEEIYFSDKSARESIEKLEETSATKTQVNDISTKVDNLSNKIGTLKLGVSASSALVRSTVTPYTNMFILPLPSDSVPISVSGITRLGYGVSFIKVATNISASGWCAYIYNTATNEPITGDVTASFVYAQYI